MVGREVNLLLRGAPDIGAGGLLRFYLFHVILFPLIGLVFLFVHYYKVVRFGISLPPELEAVGDDTARKVPPEKRVNFLPDIATNEIMYTAVTFALLALLSATVFAAPLENHADPKQTPLHTVAPWYFYWLQGLLKIPNVIPGLGFLDTFFVNVLGLTPKVFWGVIMGPALIGLLFIVPYVDPNPSRRFGDRKVMLGIGAAFTALILYLSLAGRPLGVPLTGFGFVGGDPAVEVGQEFIPDEGEGIVKEINFEALVPGTHEINGSPNTGAEELNKLVREINAAISLRKSSADPNGKLMPTDAKGSILIEEIQVDLRKFTLFIDYTDAKGKQQKFEKYIFLHKESGYAH